MEGYGVSPSLNFSYLTISSALSEATSGILIPATEIHHYHDLVASKSGKGRGISSGKPLVQDCCWIPPDINGDLSNPSKIKQWQIKVLLLSPLPELTIQMQSYSQIKARCWAGSISCLAEMSLWKLTALVPVLKLNQPFQWNIKANKIKGAKLVLVVMRTDYLLESGPFTGPG